MIHGASGVGKSSLLTAGLVPALHQVTMFEGRNILPVVVQVYTDWVGELGKLLRNPSPQAYGVHTSRLDSGFTPLNPPFPRGETRKSSSLPFTRGGLGWGNSTTDSDVYTVAPQAGRDVRHREGVGEIIERLRENVEFNLVTVLIFDQFEEFFFNCPNPVERKKFWEFLHLCLDDFNLPYVKVILSLREDYLHYLLEGDRFC
ncbi:MAG: hypothetical protein RMY34_07910 [Aulosira sp. DedQUE10]|nr:hypothetical protein [Aulosira sp. DedQUE10]